MVKIAVNFDTFGPKCGSFWIQFCGFILRGLTLNDTKLEISDYVFSHHHQNSLIFHNQSEFPEFLGPG